MKDLEKKTKAELIELLEKQEKILTIRIDEKMILEEEAEKLKKEKEKYIQFLRDLISEIGDQDGVLEGRDDEPETEPKSDRELESMLADAMKKLKTLEDKDKARDEVAKAEKEAYELQDRLEPLLASILEMEKYAPCAELIRKEVTDKDGNIKAGSTTDLLELVKVAFDRINEIRSAELKKLITTDTEEKSIIIDVKELRECFPELVKQIENEKVVALKKARAKKKNALAKKK